MRQSRVRHPRSRRRSLLQDIAAIFLLLAGLGSVSHRAAAGVITYTFAAPNNNAGTMAIGYPLEFPPTGGVVVFYPTMNGNIVTFALGAAPGETLATKQAKIVKYLNTNFPAFMLATPAANQVQITIPKATIGMLGAGQVPGIGVKATNGVETEGILRAKIQANGDPVFGMIEFQGLFSDEDQLGLTAGFDAGIFSASGSFDDHLGPGAFSSLDGKTIAKKFFDDFLGVASSLNVSLGFFSPGPDDGQILVSFNDPSLGSNDGISFGSTSATGSAIGAVALIAEPSALAALTVGLFATWVARARQRRTQGSRVRPRNQAA